MILEPKKIKSLAVSIVSPSICPEVMEPDAMILVFFILMRKVCVRTRQSERSEPWVSLRSEMRGSTCRSDLLFSGSSAVTTGG